MAPHLYGIHNLLSCQECQFDSVLRADQPIVNPVCCNCGAPNSADRIKRQAAPAVRVSSLSAPPQRWGIYAFRAPRAGDSDGKITVKRVVGLPGETLHLSEGDLWINGAREVKGWQEQRKLAILLRDFRFLPRDDSGQPISPWLPAEAASDWSFSAEAISFRASKTGSAGRRINYRHWAGYHTGQDRFAATPILDAQPFDPLEARSLSPVCDLMVTAKLGAPAADFRLGLLVYDEPLICEWQATNRKIEIRSGERLLHSVDWEPTAGETILGFSSFDRAATVMVNGKQLAQVPIPLRPLTDRNRLAQPLFIEALGSSLVLRDLKLYRDVHYVDRASDSAGADLPRNFRLSSGEYFLLGDNPVDSIDSRDWPSCGLKRDYFLGEVEWSGPKSD